MIFGRESKSKSHWIYKTPNPGKSLKLANSEGMLVELRSTGCMTVFPGSVHESGEEIRFAENGEPTEIEFDELASYARRLAAASLLMPHWKEGHRHNLALALAGTLLTGGMSEEDARQLFQALIETTGDREEEDRLKCLTGTVKRLEEGQSATGRAQLAEITGEKVANRICEWLRLTFRYPVGRGSLHDVTRAYGGAVPASDMANAERFAARNRDRARYCYGLREWFVWDGCRWANDDNGEVDRLGRATVKDMLIEAADRESVDWAAKSHSLKRLRDMVILAQAECSVRFEEFDADTWKLNSRSGVIDLMSGEHGPHNPRDLMLRQAPVSFDLAAECPTFLRFLDRIFANDNDLIGFLQRAIGYSLTGEAGEQCLFVLVGNGANGKSTLIGVLQDLLGDYAQQTPMETLMVTKASGVGNDIARLRGARFVAALEAEAGHRLAEAKIKQLTGGDRVAARFLYKEHFEFTPQFKLWLATNQLPVINETQEAIWRRFRVIPFEVTIPEAERDPALPEKLRAELPGILNWAISGCLDWQQGGLRPPAKVSNATKAYRAEMDVVAQFIEDCCVEEPMAEETVKALYDSFTDWCRLNGEQATGQRTFSQRLQERRHSACRIGKARKRRGIRLKSDAEILALEMYAPAERRAAVLLAAE
jgi:P4 family phage/plasmid primase-like protien